MRETETREIGDYKYICTQYDLMTSLSVIRRLVKYLGKPAGIFVASMDKKKEMLDQDIAQLNWGEAMTELCSLMTDKELFDFIQLCVSCVVLQSPQGKVGGNLRDKAVLDAHFMDVQLGGLIKIILFSIEVNYKTFLDGLTEVLPAGLLK